MRWAFAVMCGCVLVAVAGVAGCGSGTPDQGVVFTGIAGTGGGAPSAMKGPGKGHEVPVPGDSPVHPHGDGWHGNHDTFEHGCSHGHCGHHHHHGPPGCGQPGCDGPFSIRVDMDVPGGYPASSWRADGLVAGDEPILHVIGVYESQGHVGFRDPTVGRLLVHVGPTLRPIVLALSSYDTNEWALDLAEGAKVAAVYLYGYDPQTVDAPADIPVTDFSQGGTSGYGYCWPYCSGGSNTQGLVADVEEATGLPLSAFDGSYHADEVWIRHECGDCQPDCDGRDCGPDGCGGSCGECMYGAECTADGQCVAPTAPPGCEGVMEDPHVCLALTITGAALLGLESGTLCPIGPQTGLLSAYGLAATSIAWVGDDVYACNPMSGYDGLVRVSMTDGSFERIPLQGCEGVAAWNGGLIIASGIGQKYCADLDAARAGTCQDLDLPVTVTRIATQGDRLYGAWHSTNQVQSCGLPDGADPQVLTLEGFDGWVQGLAVTDDGLLAINSWPFQQRIAIFDAATGAALWDLTDLDLDDPQFTGLVCRTQ